ncbi:hypothetical protein BKA70DRAFT_1283150 [Coprinopsis sp. MPI-PUGE-AT-0042]|nr:hypothetical protein BKA70DRAFT_1283150 [Coprinopsis sp. MPI-PUGE-AT-0042]
MGRMLFDMLLVVLYIVVHALAFLLAGGWTKGWACGIYDLWKTVGEMPWYWVFFAMFGTVGASIAILQGLALMLLVLVAFVSPLRGGYLCF